MRKHISRQILGNTTLSRYRRDHRLHQLIDLDVGLDHTSKLVTSIVLGLFSFIFLLDAMRSNIVLIHILYECTVVFLWFWTGTRLNLSP